MKNYTVVISCECGCDDTNVYHVSAKTVGGAITGARSKSKACISIVAVFEGHLMDKTTEEQRRAVVHRVKAVA